MTLYEALSYLVAGLAASLVVSAIGALVAGAYAWWRDRADLNEVDAIVGSLPRNPNQQEHNQ